MGLGLQSLRPIGRRRGQGPRPPDDGRHDRDWRTTAVATFNSFAISNGTLWGWGHGPNKNAIAPRQIGSGTNWLAISAYGTVPAGAQNGWNTLAGGPRRLRPAFHSDWPGLGLGRNLFRGSGPFFARRRGTAAGGPCVQDRPRRGPVVSSRNRCPCPSASSLGPSRRDQKQLFCWARMANYGRGALAWAWPNQPLTTSTERHSCSGSFRRKCAARWEPNQEAPPNDLTTTQPTVAPHR